MPAGWSLTKKVLSHAWAGGITNTMTVVYIAMRLGQTSLRWKQRAGGFANTLRQVVDPTLGGRMCEIPVDKDDGINTAKGLLDWKSRRTAWVTVPTVYSKDIWLGHAMDLPGDKIEGMNVEVLDKVLNRSVPGKLMALVAASLEITESGACAKEPHRDRKRKTETESLQTTKQPKGLLGSKEFGESSLSENEALLKRVREELPAPEEGGKAKRSRVHPVTITCKGKSTKAAPVVETVAEDDEDIGLKGKPEPRSTVAAKAVKSDDAEVPKHLWNSRVFEPASLARMNRFDDEEKEVILDKIRRGLHVVWKRKVERDFIEWFHSLEHRFDEREDIWIAELRACVYARRSDWWEWKGGSHIFFWRWSSTYKKEALEGVPPYNYCGPSG
jgi:hypothetical protein